ncbi:MAG: PQQ-like beta-propeller repeat protein [Gemmataceae bacterium]|nr:PQQ-like beta-propeller repeat protein [Gemmataceae bacterium]
MNLRAALVIVSLFACGPFLRGADWPQFRGPGRTGVSKETGLLKQWPDKGPNLLWTYKNAGLGFSGMAVADGKIYTLGTRGDDEIIIALDANDQGKELWAAKIGPIFTFKGNSWGDGPRSTPTLDGNLLFALGGQGELVCVDVRNNGKEVWRKNLIKDFNGEMMSEWGYSESPLVDGDLLICTPGGDDGTLAALKKKTGERVWRSAGLKKRAPYTSVTVAEIHGVRQYIQLSAESDKNDGFLSGIAAADGKLLWTTPLFKGFVYSLSSSPPIVAGNTVYVTYRSETNSNCHAFALSADFQVKDQYNQKSKNAMANNHGGVVLVDGKVYGFSDKPRPAWVCQDIKSGKALWSESNALEGGSGSIIYADGRLYLFSDDGEAVLIEANPKEWAENGRFKLPERSKLQKERETSSRSGTWSHPAIADGRLYLRDHELIFCYDVRGK